MDIYLCPAGEELHTTVCRTVWDQCSGPLLRGDGRGENGFMTRRKCCVLCLTLSRQNFKCRENTQHALFVCEALQHRSVCSIRLALYCSHHHSLHTHPTLGKSVQNTHQIREEVNANQMCKPEIVRGTQNIHFAITDISTYLASPSSTGCKRGE